MTANLDDAATLYRRAAESFADLVAALGGSSWDGPGLGGWDLRGLVGHTSRALVTVLNYLDQPAGIEAIESPEGYFAVAARQPADPDAIAERGRQAGEDLGPRPAEVVRDLADRAGTKAAAADPDELITVLGGGIRVRNYLPTRTFELVVHSFDISAVTGVDATFSPAVLAHAAALAARVAVALGEGQNVLAALTGRRRLAEGFSIVS